MVLISSLRRCLAADVFLRPLADKFARLALQLVARYTGWLRTGIGQPNDGSTDTVRTTNILSQVSHAASCMTASNL